MRFTGLAAFLVVVLCASGVSAQESHRVSFAANPKAPELTCPAAPRAARPPAPPATPAAPDEDPEVVPTEADLGELAHPSPVPLPTIDAALVSGFSVRGADGRVQPRRIGVWGDSHMASGVFSGELIRAIGSQGAEVEASYLPPTMGRSGVRLPIRKYCQATTWRIEPAYTSASRGVHKGPSLVDLRSTGRGAYLWIDFRLDAKPSRVTSVRVMYLPTATASTLGITLDNGTEQRIPLSRNTGAAGPLRTADIEVVTRDGAPLSTIKLRVVEGVAVLQGFMLTHRDPRPVTMDVFGLPSATVRGWAQVETGYMKDALRGTSYDAVILQYGTNEGNDARFDIEKYSTGLATALDGLRAVFPDAACLLIGPTDRGVRIRKPSARSRRAPPPPPPPPPDLMKYARVHREITQAQAEVGKRYNCASWDWQAFMGGPASIYSWVLENPPRAARDLTHLTPAGYRQSAAGLASALGWNGTSGN